MKYYNRYYIPSTRKKSSKPRKMTMPKSDYGKPPADAPPLHMTQGEWQEEALRLVKAIQAAIGNKEELAKLRSQVDRFTEHNSGSRVFPNFPKVIE